MKKNRTLWITSLMGLLVLIMNACYYDEVLPKVDAGGDVGEMSFAADIVPIFNASCNGNGCHSKGGQKPDLSSASAYTSLINGGYIDKATPENSSLYKWMIGDEAQPMPLSGSNASYNAKVLAWIEQGALNN